MENTNSIKVLSAQLSELIKSESGLRHTVTMNCTYAPPAYHAPKTSQES